MKNTHFLFGWDEDDHKPGAGDFIVSGDSLSYLECRTLQYDFHHIAKIDRGKGLVVVWRCYALMLHEDGPFPLEPESDFDDNQQSIRNMFNDEIKPLVIEQYGPDDQIAINEEFNSWTDSLCKEGNISSFMYSQITLED